MNKELSGIYPGEILHEDFLEPMNISAYRLAKETNIDPKRISDILAGKRGISADTALRFARFFGNSAQFWLNLQNHYDLEIRKDIIGEKLKEIKSAKELKLA